MMKQTIYRPAHEGFGLEQFTRYCPEELVDGVVPMFKNKAWILTKITSGGGGNPAEVEALKNEVAQLKTLAQSLQTNLNSMTGRVQALERDNTEATKFIDVAFNNETEKTVSDSFVTPESIVDYVFTNGDTAGVITTYVNAGSVRVHSTAPETGTFRLQITKKK